jgi:outer membrane receptor protein involved in Fe transport
MTLGEIGYKYADKLLQFYPTLFYTTYDNVSFHSQVYNTDGTPINQIGYASTKTEGLELEGSFTPSKYFDLSYDATWQSAHYENYAYTTTVANSTSSLITTDYSGNQLIRIPKFSFRMVPGLNLMNDRLRLQLSYEYEGARYVDAANSVILPAYTVLGFAARYQINKATQLFFYVDNINNSEGLTEGNPRAGEIQSTDVAANTFLARPILGRSFRLALKLDF